MELITDMIERCEKQSAHLSDREAEFIDDLNRTDLLSERQLNWLESIYLRVRDLR